MAKIETIRHSLAHILALSIRELYPKTKFGIGPVIENGFYYDFDLPEKITLEDLPKIENKMKEKIKNNIVFKKQVITKNEAKKIFKNQPYKLELINEKSKTKNNKLTLYRSENFIDLCQGPHAKSTLQLTNIAFKLTKIAGAYWKGSEKNPMLTRIYGVAFHKKEELKNYLQKEKEAEKRDHRFLGQRLELFRIDENVGSGLILWQPKGAMLKRIVENFALEEYLKNGYQPVCTPHVAKLNLWKISGHTEFYKENMFPLMRMEELNKEEKEDYQIKPMNCPFHILIYKSKVRSYKEMPIRYTELGSVYRYEKSGTLHGLTRVRGLTQDDAHIFCTKDQLSQELISVIRLTLKILKSFGFKKFNIFLSTRPKSFVGSFRIWQKAENSLKYALKKTKLPYHIDKEGGAFYGPKIDIKIKDAVGREWQCTTIQLDFNLPERFNITYVDQKGKNQQSIMIHRALLGSLERFIGILIEYYAGAFPLWISPEQVWVIPLGKSHKKYAEKITDTLKSFAIRARIKDGNETVSKKIREGEIQKIPYLIVVGDKEIKNDLIRIRKRGKGDLGTMKLNKFMEKIKTEEEKKV